jgi:tRNA threonylcarbamoyladenosine biosynthesis protein TsaE
MVELFIESEEAMRQLGMKIAPLLTGGDIVYLRGELGAGKTTLVRGIARGMGYPGKVTSPTFTIMNIYPANPEIFHFDFYRLEDGDLSDLGLDDYLHGDGVTFIEWPDIGWQDLPEEALIITISLTEDDYDRERQVKIAARGFYYEKKLKEIENAYSGS